MPLSFFVGASAAVLLVSFGLLAVAWPKPRWQDPSTGGRTIGFPVRTVREGLAWVGILGLGLTIVSGLIGPDNPARNPAPVLVFVVFWLVVPFFSALVVDVYPDLWTRLARWAGLGGRPDPGSSLWPATGAFVAFTWLELVSPDTGPRALALAAAAYTAYLMLVGWRWGAEAVGRFDGFRAYTRLLARMAPLEFTARGIVWRGFLKGLPQVEERPGLVGLVVAMIGTVTYDGLSATPWWDSVVAAPGRRLLGALGRLGADVAVGTAGLLGITVLIGLGYLAACWVAARMGGGDPIRVAQRFAHSLVPIGFAYAFAHYFTLIAFEGQLLISTLSDPFGLGWDLFGTADRSIDFTWLSPDAVWYLQVATIVAGHVAGVVLAHDRALADFPPDVAVRTQYAMLVLMIFLTGLGLAILAAG
ncbi:MAG: hypothetical protein KatS3mg011_0278 [Acidimicrobiia bacterium]|nr:MAG: hypothetical protein KatS3mg011_0278 [Acidimicrobiia bacterium]